MRKITCPTIRFNFKSLLLFLVLQFFLLSAGLQAQTQYNGCNLGGTSSSSTGYFGGFENGANNFGTNASTDLVIVTSGNTSSGEGRILTNTSAIGGAANLSPNSGSYLFLAHPKANNDRLWYKTIAVTSGITYEFCFYVANVKTNPASVSLNIVMNGVIVTSQSITTSQTNPSYTQICGQYTVPAGVTSMQIAITVPNAGTDGAAGKSNFLALDDLCFKQVTVFTLGNQVWYDANNNGVKDVAESGIAGVTVNLYNSVGAFITSTTTGANGIYSFTNLTTGNYSVGIALPTGYANTTSLGTSNSTDNLNDGVTVAAGEIKTTTFSLTSSSVNIDFGLIGTGSIGDFVWNDTNANGVQNFGEAGIAGVKVTLTGTNIFGNPVSLTTTTGANGQYLFSNLVAGTYTVAFTSPSGYNFSPQGNGTTATDSNPNSGGTSAAIVLASGENNTTIDAGLFQYGSISDFVWNDTNANGVQDGGEAGIAGVTVTLTGTNSLGNPVNLTTTTNANGQYLFSNLLPGTYTVTLAAPAGYFFSPQGNGTSATDSNANASGTAPAIILASGENNSSIDAGLFQYGSISNFVWSDTNANGVQNGGEAGIAGVTVSLTGTDAFGNAVNLSTSTDANGLYIFSNLVPGTYTVSFGTPSGYHFSPQGNGTTATDSNPNSGGTSAAIVLASGENNTTIDAGLFQYGSIGDFVWNDTNANGSQDGGEAGIAGVAVTLTGTDAFGNPVNLNTTTDANGNYIFNNLTPGTYTVTFGTPNCYISSPVIGAVSNATNSDAVGGAVANIALVSGQNITYVDAGYHLPAQPTLLCYQSATFNYTTCKWDITGTQPTAPTVLCYQTATWNPTTCIYDITGTQPTAPTVLCYQTATWNPNTCIYDITGTQPTAPTVLCYQTATWNPNTCIYDITGTQPTAPTVLCYQTATWNPNTCVYDITGTQPTAPTVLCYQIATWNPTTCIYDITGTQPTAPTVLCYQTATWNPTTCVYDITGTQPEAPTVLCYQTATWNPNTCVYDVTGTQPTAPTVLCYQTATWNPTTCIYDITGTQPEAPTVLCYQTATWNPNTCIYDITGTQPVKPTTACYETATFNTTSCEWIVTGTQPVKPTTACYETATFNTTSCQWVVTGTQPVKPTTACYETATFNTTSCEWIVTGTQPVRPTTACYQTATFNTTSCQWIVTGTQPVRPTVDFVDNCNGTWTVTAHNYTGSLLWSTGATTPSITVTAAGTYTVKQLINGCESQAAAANVVRTCLGGDIFHTGTTCSDFRQGGNGRELDQLCYSTSANKISVVTPGVLFYYTAIVAPSTNFTIKVTEAKGSSTSANAFGLMSIQGSNQIVLWDSICGKKSDAGVITNGSQGSLTITNASPGMTYVLSVKYDSKSIQGGTYTGSTAPTVNYNFSTSVDDLTDTLANNFVAVPNSLTSISVVSGCSVSNPVTTTTAKMATTTTARMATTFDVYPVPFRDELNVKYSTIQRDSDVTIEIFDINGVLLQTIYDTKVYNDKEIKFNTTFSSRSGQMYFMRITTNKGTEIKKIVSIKE